MKIQKRVLVTGITGFVGTHAAIQLLSKGYKVCGTLRDLAKSKEIKDIISEHVSIANLSLIEAELTTASHWDEASKNIDYILHIASPFPRDTPKDDNELIIPAQKGALNVLGAAAKNGVKRVVMTSSTASMMYGRAKDKRSRTYSESDWTNVNCVEDCTGYQKSKTLAERAAWDFINEDNSGLELVTICPGLILGPVLGADYGTSAGIIVNFINGTLPAVPNLGYDTVDVRSVAELHILAMESPNAAGERFGCTSGFIDFKQMLNLLKDRFKDRNFTTHVIADEVIREQITSNPEMEKKLADFGEKRLVDSSKAKNLLGWNPIDTREAVIACAESLQKQFS